MTAITFFILFLLGPQVMGPARKKPRRLFPGNPAISSRPVAFRPRLSTGLAFSIEIQISTMPVPCQVFIIRNVIFFPKNFGWNLVKVDSGVTPSLFYADRPTIMNFWAKSGRMKLKISAMMRGLN
jgi:hypothetical protein